MVDVLNSILPLLITEPADEYHRRSKENLSSHQLGDLRKCPYLHYKKKNGLIVEEDRPAFAIGRAVHTLALEGRQKFDATYTVGGPVNPRTGKPFGASTQAYSDWASAQTKPVLSDEQFTQIQRIAAGVTAHAGAKELLADGVAEGVIRTEYCGVRCQARFDFFNPKRGLIDLKTTDDLDYFCADAHRYGYLYQLSFYQALLSIKSGVKADDIPAFLIGVEKREPYRAGVWRIAQDALPYGRGQNEAAIRRLIEYQHQNYWPTGFENELVFDRI